MNQNFAETQELVGLVAAAFNIQVAEAYAHRTDPEGQRRNRLLRINPEKDPIGRAQFKMDFFYKVDGRLTAQIPQPVSEGSRVIRSEQVTMAELRLKPSKKLINGSPAGYYRVTVPHMLADKWEALIGYEQEFGNQTMLYVFGDKRQIKINVSSEKEGHRCINHLLRVVDPAFICGTSEEHTYVGRRAKNAKPHRLTGLKAAANLATIRFPDKTEYSHQI